MRARRPAVTAPVDGSTTDIRADSLPPSKRRRARSASISAASRRPMRHPKLATPVGLDRPRVAPARWHYLRRLARRAARLRAFLPTARSVISLAVVYNTESPYSTEATASPAAWRSRATRGATTTTTCLRRAAARARDVDGRGRRARARGADLRRRRPGAGAGVRRAGGPRLDRQEHVRHQPALGSWLFLAEIVTNAALDVRRARPSTSAAPARGVSTRVRRRPSSSRTRSTRRSACRISRSRSAATSMPRFAPAIREQVYGCDICQDVCPWNRRAATSDDPAWQPREGLLFPASRSISVRCPTRPGGR